MLSDIFPTGWHAVEMSGLKAGETIVIYGGGPVGLMAALSASVKGVLKVMVVDRHPDRLRLAERVGAIAIDDSKGDPVEQVMEHTKGVGVGRGAECVRHRAQAPQGNQDNAATLNKLVASVRFTGGIGTVGVFISQDPGGPYGLSRQGKVRFDFGDFWFKGQQMACGQAPVKRYNRHLGDLIAADKVAYSRILSHNLALAEAPEAYKHFDAREDGWTKVVLNPA
ncbi:zinc-binding dehydrogenase [Nocardiopsis nanhaiensis]